MFLNLAECDMQCSVKVTGVFIGTRTCKCIERYKPSSCSNKGNNIWTCTSPCDLLCTSREGRWPGDIQKSFTK